VSWSEDKH